MAAGAVYDRGVFLYMSGLMGPRNDAVGALTVAYLKTHYPDFRPARILDLGCGVGHATLPYCDAYPDAEVVGIDVGAGAAALRRRARAELGQDARFEQRDAEATGLPAGSFDLVTSHIVLHETSGRALHAILAEARRLLAPGGLTVHVDQPRFDGADAGAPSSRKTRPTIIMSRSGGDIGRSTWRTPPSQPVSSGRTSPSTS
jgi:ubiquinone/menaquinone biosynthesis C-methylase UbiE